MCTVSLVTSPKGDRGRLGFGVAWDVVRLFCLAYTRRASRVHALFFPPSPSSVPNFAMPESFFFGLPASAAPRPGSVFPDRIVIGSLWRVVTIHGSELRSVHTARRPCTWRLCTLVAIENGIAHAMANFSCSSPVAVTVGGLPCAVRSARADAIECEVSPLLCAPGFYDIVIAGPDGLNGTLPGGLQLCSPRVGSCEGEVP